VQEIVRDHNGAINVESIPGRGSRFEVWLPVPADHEGTEKGAAGASLGHGETVLVVERKKEQLLRDEEMLAALGYEPVGFERPADAIEACRSTPRRFDIILISDASSDPASIDLARTLQGLAPRQPIVLATALTSGTSSDVLADAGISEVLRRPLVGAELAAALSRALRFSGALHS
jgi:DNA-binding response OmpR family regulator